MSKYKKLINIDKLNIKKHNISLSQLPTVQKFFVSQIKRNDRDTVDSSLYEYVKRIELADNAFEASILSYAVYSDNSWVIDKMGRPISEMRNHFLDTINNQDADKNLYKLKVWNYLSDNFQKVDLSQYIQSSGKIDNESGIKTDYSFKDSQYSSLNGLSHAGVFMSTNQDGSKTLNLSFRGTEFKDLLKYIKGPYLNMTTYYSTFEPLEKAILEYARDSKNNVSNIVVTGHSLGGAMAQEFLRRNKNTDSLSVEGYTFGSPGSHQKGLIRFINLGYRLIQKFKGESIKNLAPKKIVKDERLHEFYHTNDPIPKVGLVGYRKGGQRYNLFDSIYKNDRDTRMGEVPSKLEKVKGIGVVVSFIKQKLINAWAVRFHDSQRYVKNTQSVIEQGYRESSLALIPVLKETTVKWKKYINSDKNFIQISLKNKEDLKSIMQEKYPNFSNEEIDNMLLSYREFMKYESKTNIALAAYGENRFYNQNFTEDLKGEAEITVKQKIDIKKKIEQIKKQHMEYMDLSVDINKLGLRST